MTTTTEPEPIVPPDLDDDEDDQPEHVILSVQITRFQTEYRAQVGWRMSFTDPQSSDVVLTMLRTKVDQIFFEKLPEGVRGRVALSLDCEDSVFWLRAALPADLWDAAPGDTKEAFLGSHLKLALAATLRALAIGIEAHDLFSLGKSVAGPIHARMSAVKDEPKPS
jgi:hypothetical protein